MAKINFNINEWNLLKNKWKQIIYGLDCDIAYPELRSRINIDKLNEIENKISPDKLALIKTLIGRELPYEGYEEFQHIITDLNLDYEEIIKLEIFEKYDYEPVSFEEGSDILYSAVEKEEKEHKDIIKGLIKRKQITSEMGEIIELVYDNLLDYHRSLGQLMLDGPLICLADQAACDNEKFREVLINELKQLGELFSKNEDVQALLKDKRKLIAGCIDYLKRYRKGASDKILQKLYDIYNPCFIEKMPEGCNDPEKTYWDIYYIYQDDKNPEFTEKPCPAIIKVADILVELMK